jgi:hypothetical protein
MNRDGMKGGIGSVMHDLTGKYEWADQDYNLAWTVSVIKGRTVDEIVTIYGGNPKAVQFMQFKDAQPPIDEFGEYFYLQVLTLGDTLIAIENNGWSGNLPEISRQASKDAGQFFSVYWNVEGRWHILEARNGTVTAYFDVGLRHDSDLLPEWITEIDPAAPNMDSLCLAVLEKQTGIAFDRTWLTTELPTYRIPDPDHLMKDVPGARLP